MYLFYINQNPHLGKNKVKLLEVQVNTTLKKNLLKQRLQDVQSSPRIKLNIFNCVESVFFYDCLVDCVSMQHRRGDADRPQLRYNSDGWQGFFFSVC